MKIKHRIIGEYATKRCFIEIQRGATDRNSFCKTCAPLFGSVLRDLHTRMYFFVDNELCQNKTFVFVYLANTAVLCYSLTIICCCQVQDYIYWIISTENDHRHHHKFIKYENKTTFRSVFANNSVFNLHFMKVSTENDNNFGYEKIPIVVDYIPLSDHEATIYDLKFEYVYHYI
jgi:hypothetical protein